MCTAVSALAIGQTGPLHHSTASEAEPHLRNRAEATQLTFMAYQTAMTDTYVIS